MVLGSNRITEYLPSINKNNFLTDTLGYATYIKHLWESVNSSTVLYMYMYIPVCYNIFVHMFYIGKVLKWEYTHIQS